MGSALYQKKNGGGGLTLLGGDVIATSWSSALASWLQVLKTRLGLILAKAVAMRVMINATGCPAPVLDRNRMNTHKHLSQLIASAVDLDIPTPV